MSGPEGEMSIGDLAMIACLLEARAPKAGNVRPGKDFENTTLKHFLDAAAAISDPLDRAMERPLGDSILEAVTESCKVTGQNGNLGMIVLLATLAAALAPAHLRVGGT